MNRLKISLLGTAACLLGLGISDTAKGQTLTTVPSVASGISFQVPSGGAVASQNLTVTNTQGSTTLQVNLQNAPSWLTINGTGAPGTIPAINTAGDGSTVLVLKANTTGLNTGQTYSGSFTIQVNALPSSQITYPVVLTVGAPSLLTASPALASFSAVVGASAGSPSAGLPETITSSGAQLNYTVSAQTQAASGNWILLTSSSGTTSSSTPGFTIQVNPAGLAVGNYSGTVTVQSTTTADSVTIPVSLTVNMGSALNVTPATLNNFIFQSNSQQQNFSGETQTLMVSTTTGSIYYQVTATAPAGQTTNWLLVSPTQGLATTTPQSISVSLSAYQYVAALAPGTYTIDLTITPTGSSGGGTTIPVTLVVSNNPLLTVNTKLLTFSVPLGGAAPSQTVTISSSGSSSVPYSVQSNQPWLSVTPSAGTTTGVITVSVNPTAAGLAASATPYTGTVTVYPSNNDFNLYNIPITVSLTVTSATSQVFAAPDQLLFSYQTTLPPPVAQQVQLTSAVPVGIAVTTATTAATNCPTSNWLTWSTNQNSTPATLSIGVVTTGMTAGTCTGTVTVTYNNGANANSTLAIPVTVNIAATSLLTITPDPGFGVFTATSSNSAPTISTRILINSTDGTALPFSAYASTPGASWLTLGNSSGSTLQYLTVNILPSGLAVGVYSGSITIHATNAANLPSGDITLPVTLTISANTTVSVSKTAFTFTQAQGASPPDAQSITLTTSGGSTGFTASVTPVTGGNWLQVSPASGTATSAGSSINLSVAQNSLSPGTYTSDVTLAFVNSATPTIPITVTLTVTSAQSVTVSTTPLTFNYQLGAAAPATQTLNVTSTGGPVAIAVGTTSSGWLSVTPATGSTGASGAPLVLTVAVVPAAFTTAGSFNGTITITPAGQAAITVPVTVIVTGVPPPQPASISNSASGLFGAIAPGELITIKGTNIGPATPASFSVAAGNTVISTLSGVQVTFDGIAGTPTYVSSSQINVIVPYEIAGRASTSVVVSYQGTQSGAIPQNVANQAPGIYTFSATGAGQASVLNQNGSYNGPAGGITVNGQNVSTTPAAAGSVIAVYMTGGGQTSPASVTGTVTPTSTLYKIPGTVTATINGVNAVVEFAGAAPGLVTGVIQVNILVPAGVSGNALPLVININNTATTSGPTVAVQ